jgi:hypothetical protein
VELLVFLPGVLVNFSTVTGLVAAEEGKRRFARQNFIAWEPILAMIRHVYNVRTAGWGTCGTLGVRAHITAKYAMYA